MSRIKVLTCNLRTVVSNSLRKWSTASLCLLCSACVCVCVWGGVGFIDIQYNMKERHSKKVLLSFDVFFTFLLGLGNEGVTVDLLPVCAE